MSAMAKTIVEVTDLCKRYGTVEAVKSVSFSIFEGGIFGLLGPNGAGKTTTIEMIEGLRVPDSGRVLVAGVDPARNPQRVREIIGAQLQTSAMHDKIRIREAFRLFASFYRRPRPYREVLEMVGLQAKEECFYSALSGGEKQRVSLGLALIGDPKVVFLDEPTSGLDVTIRLQLHEVIRKIRTEGKAILMSTHYIEEAEKLCDQVGIMHGGRLRDVASPQDLIRKRATEERVEVVFAAAVSREALQRLNGVVRLTVEDARATLYGPSGGIIAASVTAFSEASANVMRELKIVQTRLEDVYLKMTANADPGSQ